MLWFKQHADALSNCLHNFSQVFGVDVSTSVAELIDRSRALERAGDISAARMAAQRAVANAQNGDLPRLTDALAQLAHIHFRQGQYATAQSLAEDVLARSTPTEQAYVNALMVLGLCAAETGNPAAAETHFQQAIELARSHGFRHILRAALHNLSALVYVPQGKFSLALAADAESLRLAIALDMSDARWFPLATMGWVHFVCGQYADAAEIADRLAVAVQPNSLGEGFYFCLRGDLAQEGDSPADAEQFYARARTIAETIGDPGLNVLLRLGLSRYFRRMGNPAAAFDWADDARAIAERVGYRHLQGMALVARGRAAWRAGNFSAAETDFRAAIDVLSPLNANFDLTRAHYFLAVLAHRQKNPAAESLWLEAANRIIAHGYTFLLDASADMAFPLLADCLHSENPQVLSVSTRLLDYLQQTPPPKLFIRALGRFEVRQNQRVIPAAEWGRRCAGKLFRLLLVSPNRSQTREQIIESLWREKTPSSAKALLHQATSSLRHLLEPKLPRKFPSRYLQVEGGWVALRLPPGSQVDFEMFEQHYHRREWAAAFALYRGELFPDDRYEDWAALPRERLRQMAVRVAMHVAQEAFAAERFNRTLDACRRALSLEPWEEEAVLLGMKAYLALNDRAGAIRLYRTLAQRLQSELGIEPQKTLQNLYESLLK